MGEETVSKNFIEQEIDKLLKIIGRKEQPVLKICSQPLYICGNGLYKLSLFLSGIGIVKAKVKFAYQSRQGKPLSEPFC